MSSDQVSNNKDIIKDDPPRYEQFPMEMYPPNSVVVTSQPCAKGSDGDYGMQELSGVPPGLEYLNMIDQLLVHQKVELLEVLCGCETKNKYHIKNSMGQNVYKATEDTDCCTRNCCGPLRPFDMKIVDNSGCEVIHLYRDLRCAGCCCPCCLQRLEVYAPPGNLVGIVVQEWSILTPSFSVRTPEDEVLFLIDGPICACNCCSDVNFNIYRKDDGNAIGKITKQWSGFIREMYTDADHFGITFPLELDVNKKATLLGALFLIDFMYFENNQKNNFAV